MRRIEGWLFQPIKHQARLKTGVEENVQGTIKVVVRNRLTQHPYPFLRAEMQIAGGFNCIGPDDFAIDGGLFHAECRASLVKAGMAQREDKAPTRLDHLPDAAHQRLDFGHIHDSLIADSSIKALCSQSHNLLLSGGIHLAVVDTVGMLRRACTGAFEELRAEVRGDHIHTELGHTACKDAVATANLQDGFTWLQVEQPLARRTDQQALELVAFTHPLVPKCGFLVPDPTRLLMEIGRLSSLSISHHWKIPFSSFQQIGEQVYRK